MIKILLDIFDILQILLIWGSFALAISVFLKTAYHLKKGKLSTKDWVAFIVSLIYDVAFVFCMIFYGLVFNTIATVLFWMIFVVSTQIAKYKDRVAGKRWWER